MQFSLVPLARIEREWPAFAERLAPAVAVDPNGKTLDSLREDLLSGEFHLIEGNGPEANGLLAFHLFKEEGQLACFASYFAASVEGGPRQMIGTMRAIMAAFELSAAQAGVTRIYIGGRDWSRIFPDYEPADNVPNRRRKVLSNG